MYYLATCISFLKFYITFTISFRRKKNRSNVMPNFIFCLSTCRHRLNQVDLQELWHCDGTRPMKNSPHCHSRRFSLHTELIHIFHDSTNSIRNKHKVKPHRNSDTKTGNREPHQNTALGRTVTNSWGGGLN